MRVEDHSWCGCKRLQEGKGVEDELQMTMTKPLRERVKSWTGRSASSSDDIGIKQLFLQRIRSAIGVLRRLSRWAALIVYLFVWWPFNLHGYFDSSPFERLSPRVNPVVAYHTSCSFSHPPAVLTLSFSLSCFPITSLRPFRLHRHSSFGRSHSFRFSVFNTCCTLFRLLRSFCYLRTLFVFAFLNPQIYYCFLHLCL